MRSADYACAVIVENGSVLLGLRAPHRKAYAGFWDVIGGKVEPGESLEAALTRELREEIGIEPVAPTLIARLDDSTMSADAPPSYHLFKVDSWRGGAPTMLNHEHTELRWFTLNEVGRLSNLAMPEYLAVFEKALVETG